MSTTRAGVWVTQQAGADGFAAFIPAPLPPDPPMRFDSELQRLHEDASRAMGALDGVTRGLDPDRLLYMYVRKEAVLSSQIEGTQSTLADLLEYESDVAPGTPVGDVAEVSRYVEALRHGMNTIRTGRLPLSLRLIREVHAVLMREGRGSVQATANSGGRRTGLAAVARAMRASYRRRRMQCTMRSTIWRSSCTMPTVVRRRS